MFLHTHILLIVQAVCVLGELMRTAKFELLPGSKDIDQFEKGREKFAEYNSYAESSPCWKLALAELNSTCNALTEENQSRLALAFSNCHWERSGRETYPCPSDASFKECTCKDKMGDSAFFVYTQFFTHTSSMCYFLQSQLWQDKTEMTINLLSDVSDTAVSKLEEALDYHRLLDRKQDESLNNQQVILDQDRRIAESLDKTSTKMGKAFQEMQDKAERHNLLLDDSLGKLLRGVDSVKWLLSFILGEVIQLETVWFFVVAFLVVTMVPQFGMSRLILYAVLAVYGFVEAMLRRMYLWIAVVDSSNMATLHYLLYWLRWVGVVVLAVVYLYCWLAHVKEDRKMTGLLQSVNDRLELVWTSMNGLESTSRRPSDNTPVAPDNSTMRVSPPHSPADYQQHQRPLSFPFASSLSTLEEFDSGVNSFQPGSCSVQERLQHGNQVVVPLSQVKEYLQAEGQYLTGTQILDYLSGVYIARNACEFSPDEFSDHSDESDFTYIPDNDTVSHVSSDIASVDMLNRTHDALGGPLTRTPLVLHQSLELYPPGNAQQLPGGTPLSYHQSIDSVSGVSRHKQRPGTMSKGEEFEKEVAEEKDGLVQQLLPRTPHAGRSRPARNVGRQSGATITTIKQTSNRTTTTTPTSISRYNLRPRGLSNS